MAPLLETDRAGDASVDFAALGGERVDVYAKKDSIQDSTLAAWKLPPEVGGLVLLVGEMLFDGRRTRTVRVVRESDRYHIHTSPTDDDAGGPAQAWTVLFWPGPKEGGIACDFPVGMIAYGPEFSGSAKAIQEHERGLARVAEAALEKARAAKKD